jgi:hypothetical protein
MHFARTTASVLAMLLIAGCNSSEPATLFREGETQIKVTVISKTGDNLPAPIECELPSGTHVSILDGTSSEPTVKIFINEGEHKGKEATARRDVIRRTE